MRGAVVHDPEYAPCLVVRWLAHDLVDQPFEGSNTGRALAAAKHLGAMDIDFDAHRGIHGKAASMCPLRDRPRSIARQQAPAREHAQQPPAHPCLHFGAGGRMGSPGNGAPRQMAGKFHVDPDRQLLARKLLPTPMPDAVSSRRSQPYMLEVALLEV